jgi:hypothetical protein
MQAQVGDLLRRTRASGACGTADAEALSRDGHLRDEVYRALLADPQRQDWPLVCFLLDYETKEHKLHDGLSDNLVISAYLLAIQRRVEDAPRLWEAKAANFSTWLGLSVVLLVAAGVDETIAFWKKEKGWMSRKPAKTALDVIKRARVDGKVDDIDGQLAQIRTYCENSLNNRIA